MTKTNETTLLAKAQVELTRKIRTLFSLTGFRGDVLPGIRICIVPAIIVLEHWRQDLLDAIGLGTLVWPADHIVIGVLSVLVGVACWFVSGWLFDPPYDWLYGPDKAFTKRDGRYGPFPSGYQFNKERQLARSKLSDWDKKYEDARYSIYQPVLDTVEKYASSKARSIKTTLTNSKTIRNAILPIMALIYAAIWSRSFGLAFAFLVLAIVMFVIHCSLRMKHSLDAYVAYNNPNMPAQ